MSIQTGTRSIHTLEFEDAIKVEQQQWTQLLTNIYQYEDTTLKGSYETDYEVLCYAQ